MLYLGCLPLLAIIILVVAFSLLRNVLHILWDILYGLLLTIQDFFYGLFRPTPTESEIEDMNYYHETHEREKLYDKEDGEYVSYKSVKR